MTRSSNLVFPSNRDDPTLNCSIFLLKNLTTNACISLFNGLTVRLLYYHPFFCVDIMDAPDGSIEDPVTRLYRKNATLFKCLQITVSNWNSWTKEDVRHNLHGGNIFNHGDDRTCPVLDGIELQLARPRTYSVSTSFLDLQHVRIFPSYQRSRRAKISTLRAVTPHILMKYSWQARPNLLQ